MIVKRNISIEWLRKRFLLKKQDFDQMIRKKKIGQMTTKNKVLMKWSQKMRFLSNDHEKKIDFCQMITKKILLSNDHKKGDFWQTNLDKKKKEIDFVKLLWKNQIFVKWLPKTRFPSKDHQKMRFSLNDWKKKLLCYRNLQKNCL